MTPGTAVRITGDDVLGRRLAGMTGVATKVKNGMVWVAVSMWSLEIVVVPEDAVELLEDAA